MTNTSHPRTTPDDIWPAPRIASGLEFVQRWEARALFVGLCSGDRAHRILLELARRLAEDHPPDQDAGFERLYEMQQFLNAMGATADGRPEIPLDTMLKALDEIKHTLTCARDTSPELIAHTPAILPANVPEILQAEAPPKRILKQGR